MKDIASIFLLLIAFLNVQPLFSSKPMVAEMKCCSKTMKCDKQKQAPARECGTNTDACNPFMSCVYGNFYLVEKTGITFTKLTITKITIIPVNDNRLSDTSSDFWHPPKTVYS